MTAERRLAVLMGMLVAVLLCAYTIAKVLRDALFLQEFGALKLPIAYVGVAVVSAAYVYFEGRLARRFSVLASSRFTQYSAVGFSIPRAFRRLRRWASLFFSGLAIRHAVTAARVCSGCSRLYSAANAR